MVVADGMGGTNAGEVASDIAQKSVKEAFDALDKIPSSQKEREQLLRQMVVNAHKDVVDHQSENLDTAGMGTTLVIAWVIDHMVHVSWSGDSRCYVLDPGTPLYPFSEDHSIVWDLVKQGDLTPEEARTHPNSNIISQSLGDPKSTPKPGVKSRPLYQGNKVLVCSDGLNGMLSDEEMQVLLERDQEISLTCKELVEAANAAGGHDNITCLILEVKEGNEAPAELPKTSDSSPTRTAVLRKKVKYNYAVIGILVVAVGVLGYMLFGRSANGDAPVKELPLQTYAIHIDSVQQLNLEDLLGKKGISVEKIGWNPNNHQLQKTTLTLAAPVSTTDTLSVWFEENGSHFLAKVIFTATSDTNSDPVEEERQPAEAVNPGTPASPAPENNAKPTPPSNRPESGESAPPVVTPQPRQETPVERLPLTPIVKDTTKK
jgi:protein phosphatase